MHGVRKILLKQQALALQLPLHTIELPELPDMEVYENTIRSLHRQLKEAGYNHGIFGDVFLEDLKQYRENLLAKDHLQGLFPLWQMEGKEVVRQFIAAGFQAIVVCVNNAKLDRSFCGRLLDESFLQELPPGVDPCGENGEYHTFVFDGPNFTRPVNFRVGEMVYKEYPAPKSAGDSFDTPQPPSGFYFCDLLPL